MIRNHSLMMGRLCVIPLCVPNARPPSFAGSEMPNSAWSSRHRVIDPPDRIPVVNSESLFVRFSSPPRSRSLPHCPDQRLSAQAFKEMENLRAAYGGYSTESVQLQPLK
jgi:hypothetical protein